MKNIKAGRADHRTSVEIRTFWGRSKPENQYILIKGFERGAPYFKAFALSELKDCCLDILGRKGQPKQREVNSNDLAREVWKSPASV